MQNVNEVLSNSMIQVLDAAAALLDENSAPTDQDIDQQITNICRCGTYPRIRRSIKQAADTMTAAKQNEKSTAGDLTNG
mgnify:CR=1 FL=1